MRVTTPERQSESEEELTKTTSWPSHRRTNSWEKAIQENSFENIAEHKHQTEHTSTWKSTKAECSSDPRLLGSPAEVSWLTFVCQQTVSALGPAETSSMVW